LSKFVRGFIAACGDIYLVHLLSGHQWNWKPRNMAESDVCNDIYH
jgi:hypothetical protein